MDFDVVIMPKQKDKFLQENAWSGQGEVFQGEGGIRESHWSCVAGGQGSRRESSSFPFSSSGGFLLWPCIARRFGGHQVTGMQLSETVAEFWHWKCVNFLKMHQSWVWSAQHKKHRVGGRILQVLPLLFLYSFPSFPFPATSALCSTATGSSRTGWKSRTREELPAEASKTGLTRGLWIQWLIRSELDRQQVSWPRRLGSLFETKGDKLCARDNETKPWATRPNGLTLWLFPLEIDQC